MNPLWVLILLTCPFRDFITSLESHFLNLVIAVSLNFLPALYNMQVSFINFWTETFTIQDLIQVFEVDVFCKLFCDTTSHIIIKITVLQLSLNIYFLAISCSILAQISSSILSELFLIKVLRSISHHLLRVKNFKHSDHGSTMARPETVLEKQLLINLVQIAHLSLVKSRVLTADLFPKNHRIAFDILLLSYSLHRYAS